MKKIVLGLLCVLALVGVVGCGKENKVINLDLDKVKTELDTVAGGEFYVFGVGEAIDKLNIYKNLEDLYDKDLKEIFNLDSENLEQYFVRYDKDTKDFYAILKPKEGKKDIVKTAMDEYSDDNVKFEEYQGYLIYVRCLTQENSVEENNKVMKAIKDSKEPVFGAMMEVTKDQMKDILNLDPSTVSEFAMKMPRMIINSNTYIVAKPVEGKEEEVKSALDAYMVKLEEQWKTYLPDQYELVVNRKVEKIGDYLVYIVSSNNDLVYNTIKNATK